MNKDLKALKKELLLKEYKKQIKISNKLIDEIGRQRLENEQIKLIELKDGSKIYSTAYMALLLVGIKEAEKRADKKFKKYMKKIENCK